MTDAQIIDALGGTGAVAIKMGRKPPVISNWKARGIPWRYRMPIAQIARDEGVLLPATFLLERAA